MDTSESLPFTNSKALNVTKEQSNYDSNSVIENNQTFNPNISAAQLDNFYSQMGSDQQLSNTIQIDAYSEESVATEDIIKDVADENNVQDAIFMPPNDMTTREVEQSNQSNHADSSDMTIAMSEIIVDKLSVDVSLLKKKKVCDVLRVQKVLEELSARSAPPEHVHAARYKKQKIANDARMLLLEYARELSSAILEESCLLAKHRKSKELLIPDLKLIFGKKFRVDISGYQSRSDRVARKNDVHNYEEEEEEEEEVLDKGIEGGGGGGSEMKVDAEVSETVPSASVAAPPSVTDAEAAVAVAVTATVEPPVAVVDVEVEEVEVEVEEVVEGGAEVENEETAEGGEEDSQEEENDDTSPADSDNQQEQEQEPEPEEKPVEAPVMPVLPPRKTQGYGLGKGLALGFPKIREVIEGETEGDTVRQSEQPGINPYPFSYSSQLSDSLYTSHTPASRVQDQPYVPGVGPGYTKGYGDPQGFASGGGDGQNLGYIPSGGVQSTGYAAGQNPGYGPGGISGAGGGDVAQSLGHTQIQGQGQGQGLGSMES